MSRLIPWEQLSSPQAMWADSGETVRALRDRLRALGGHDQYNSPILIRLPDGREAPTAAPMLRKLAQEMGASILRQQLGDLVDRLCPEPWSMESQGPAYREAAQEVFQRHLPVIVTEDGQPAGLMLPPSHRTLTVTVSEGTFDLFDEPLSLDDVPLVAFVTATANTTVAGVAKTLKALNAPQDTFVVVEQGSGSYGVISSSKLDVEVRGLGADVWGMSLRELLSQTGLPLRSAASAELDDVGRKQAQAIADRKGFLVITEESRPVALLLDQGVHRQAELAYDLPQSVLYGLYDAPLELLDQFAPEVTPEKTPRFVNLWFEEVQGRPMSRAEALVLGCTYHLALNVGALRELSIIDWPPTPGGARPIPIVEPQEKDAYLYVSLFSEDFDIPEPTQPLKLPREGDTELLHFEVVPLRRTRSDETARLAVCLYYRTYLVQTFQVEAEVVAAGEVGRSKEPQTARLAHARTARFPEMEQLPTRDLSLTITRDGPDRYRFTFLVDPDPDDVQSAIALSCSVRLTRDDLTHLITKARRQLYNVVQTFDLLQEQDVVTYRKATRALAQVGRQLYLKLFESPSAQALKAWMEESLPDGSTIQVVDLAGDFVFPWSLVFTEQPWADDKPLDIKKFWGWRYKLVILTDRLLDTYRQAQAVIAADEPLRISVGLYERLVGTTDQKAFFADLQAQTDQQAVHEIRTNRAKMSRDLRAADRDLYYFFCHGYTERIATDIQLDADLVGHFADIAAKALAERSAVLREHLDDLFDVSDSWLRLTRGKIPLAMLKETVPSEFSRHPLVFLNMCESAQVLPSLSDGFVPFFLQRGARAVIGTECSMNTIFADDFARAFLTRFFQGEPAGDILLALRRRYLEQGNPLALAYTLYCDADLRLSKRLLPVDSTLTSPVN